MAFIGQEFPNADFYKSDLSEILKTVKKLLQLANEHSEWIGKHEVEYLQLKDLYDALMGYKPLPESVQKVFYDWCRTNLVDLVGEVIHNVFFGLTDEGYFVAYIPESWDDIIFNTTGYDIDVELMPDYGHLVLSY